MPHHTMVSRVVRCFVCLLTVWAGARSVSLGQEPIHLKLRAERMKHARQVEEKAIAENDSLLLAEAWYLYGKTYVFAGGYETAQAYFLKSLRIHEPRGDSFELSRLYVRLSENERRLGHIDKALAYVNRSLAIAQRIHSDKALVRIYGTFGRIYEEMWNGRLDSSRQEYNRIRSFYQKAETLCYKLKDTVGVAESSIDLGRLLTRGKDPQAITYLENALATFTRKNKEGIRVSTMVYLAAAYLVFHKPQLAFQTLQRAQKLYERLQLNDYDVRLVLEKQYVAYFRSVGQWKAAFEHQGQLTALEKSQLLADNNGAVTRLTIEYDTEKKEALLRQQNSELALRTQNLQTQQRFTLATTTLFVMAAAMSFVFFKLNRKNKRISRRNTDLLKEQNHRVKNNLQVVSSLLNLQAKRLTDETAKKAVEESRLRVESMAILHRKLYDGDAVAVVHLDEFIREVVDGVLKAYGYAFLEPQYAIDTITLAADKAVPIGLILNELTTNACKYAFPTRAQARFSVSCRRSQTKLLLTVADNGPGLDGPGLDGVGLDQSDGAAGNWTDTMPTTVRVSFGMQLIQAQVEQLGGTYTFSDHSDTTSTGVVFTMEFKG